MRATTFPTTAAVLAAIVAAVVLWTPATRVELPPTPAPLDTPDSATPTQTNDRDETPAAASDTAAAAKLRELAEMSETFRNTTFLIAIRDAGFVCHELQGTYGGVNNSTTWTATCSEMLAYTVSVAGAGTLHVEPLLQQLDAVPPSAPRESTRELLPPQTR